MKTNNIKALLRLALSVSLIIAFAFSATNSYGNNSLSSLQTKQSQTRSTIQAAKDALNRANSEKTSILYEIDDINKDLETLAESLEFITEELNTTEVELEKAEAELEVAIETRDEQFDVLKGRMRFMYINKNVGYLDVLLNSASISELINRVEYIKRIYDHDKNLLLKLLEAEEKVSNTVEEISNAKNEIVTLKTIQTDEMIKLDAVVAEKRLFIENLEADSQKYAAQVKELEAEDARIAKLIANEAKRLANQRSNQTAKYTGGKLTWPVPSSGRVTSPYGTRTHPISKKKEFHKGIDISASMGANVVAAEAGTVIHSGWMNGLGNSIIINHGSISTLYGHHSRNLVSVGQTVARGEVISKAGSTGYSTGPHLHFEVHVGGATTNPMPYFSK